MGRLHAPDVILHNGRVTTFRPTGPTASAVAIGDGVFTCVGKDDQVLPLAGPATRVIDLEGRPALPGLIDNHLSVMRSGATFSTVLRWDDIHSVADALAMLKTQVAVTPPPFWVCVQGGFAEHQFAEGRLPTLEEINRLAPNTPVLIQHLEDRTLLNRAALRAIGCTQPLWHLPGGEVDRDPVGRPTGLLLAKPDPGLLHAALAKVPKLSWEQRLGSTRHFMRELNRLGVTSAVDAGGLASDADFLKVGHGLAGDRQITVRISYNLSAQTPGGEPEDFLRWSRSLAFGQGDDYLRFNGAGPRLVFSADDFGDFRQPRPEPPQRMERELEAVVRVLAANRCPWRMHATYDETIVRALDVFERVNQDIPFAGLNWFFDHAETVSDRSLDRIAALGGGIAIQNRMAYQGEYFADRYGVGAAEASPPVATMLANGLPVSAGTDDTGLTSYNPWFSLAWLITGRTRGRMHLYPRHNCMSREAALQLWTENAAWFSNDQGRKGRIEVGQLADVMVPDRDYFTCPDDDIQHISSLLTLVGGRVVYAAGPFRALDDNPPPPVTPHWSPLRRV